MLVTWLINSIIAAYAHPDRRRGKTMMTAIIDSLRRRRPGRARGVAQLGRTLHRRRTECWPTSTTTPPTDPPKRSTAAWKHSAETLSDSGI